MSQDTAPAPPQPTAEHERIAESAGVWNVACKFYMDPSQPPMEVEAKETVETFGPFFVTSLFESEMFGAPFQGRATLGYDPTLGKWVSTWIDTMTPATYHFTGGWNGKVLEMSGTGWDCTTNDRQATYRTTEEHKDDGSRVFEMFMEMADGGEIKLFTHVYTRAS